MKPPPLHDRIRQDIEGRIMSGVWEAGHRLPVEQQLMLEYGCSRMTVNKALAGLVEQGLLDRRAAPNDRRAQIVSLTAEGRRAFRTMARTHEDWIAELFAGLSPADIEALMTLLAKTKTSARKAVAGREAS